MKEFTKYIDHFNRADRGFYKDLDITTLKELQALYNKYISPNKININCNTCRLHMLQELSKYYHDRLRNTTAKTRKSVSNK